MICPSCGNEFNAPGLIMCIPCAKSELAATSVRVNNEYENERVEIAMNELQSQNPVQGQVWRVRFIATFDSGYTKNQFQSPPFFRIGGRLGYLDGEIKQGYYENDRPENHPVPFSIWNVEITHVSKKAVFVKLIHEYQHFKFENTEALLIEK